MFLLRLFSEPMQRKLFLFKFVFVYQTSLAFPTPPQLLTFLTAHVTPV
jgi:hypothetical protein